MDQPERVNAMSQELEGAVAFLAAAIVADPSSAGIERLRSFRESFPLIRTGVDAAPLREVTEALERLAANDLSGLVTRLETQLAEESRSFAKFGLHAVIAQALNQIEECLRGLERKSSSRESAASGHGAEMLDERTLLDLRRRLMALRYPKSSRAIRS